MRTTAPHFVAALKIRVSPRSNSRADVPRSPAPTTYRGFLTSVIEASELFGKIGYSYVVQVQALTFTRCLCSESLPHSWVAEQINDKPLTFAVDEVVKRMITRSMSLDQCLDERLRSRWKNEIVYRFVAPFEILDVIYIKHYFRKYEKLVVKVVDANLKLTPKFVRKTEAI